MYPLREQFQPVLGSVEVRYLEDAAEQTYLSNELDELSGKFGNKTPEAPMSTTSVHPSVQAFISDVKAIIAEHGDGDEGLQRIAGRMKDLTKDPGLTKDDSDPVGNGFHGGWVPELYKDETGLTLIRSKFGPNHKTPIHDHFTWGVVGIYAGKDKCQIWRRLDDGDDEGHAEVELADECILGPGDTLIIPHPPQNLHVQQGAGEDTYEFVLFGPHPMRGARNVFDPEKKTATKIPRAKG